MQEFISATNLIGDPAKVLTLPVIETLLLPEWFLPLLNDFNLLEYSVFFIELTIDVLVASIVRQTAIILLTLLLFSKTSCLISCNARIRTHILWLLVQCSLGGLLNRNLSTKLAALVPVQCLDFVKKTDCTEDFILNTKEKIPRMLPKLDLVHYSQCPCNPVVTLASSIVPRTRGWMRTISMCFLDVLAENCFSSVILSMASKQKTNFLDILFSFSASL